MYKTFLIIFKLSFIEQISSVCRSSLSNLHTLKTIMDVLPDNMCNLLITSTVLSRIEYCTSLYSRTSFIFYKLHKETYTVIDYYLAYNYLITLTLPKNYMS